MQATQTPHEGGGLDRHGADRGDLLARTLALRRLLRRHVLDADERYVAILLPPSAGGVVANMALAVDRRVSVNLNYTASSQVLNECLRQAGARHVLTSRRFMEKMDFQLDTELVYLEDFREQARTSDKLLAALQAYVWPAGALCRMLHVSETRIDEVLTVIFTSGSTGQPKGVMLTHGNVAHNIAAIEEAVRLKSSDVLVGVLPFFHSFGYTVTLWAVMGINVAGIYHFNPLDAKQVSKLCRQHGGTVLLATPTFLRTYVRRCEKEDLQSLEIVVTGAEKLPKDVADAFEAKFGVRPMEGYGTTELSPLVSVNIPPSRSTGDAHLERRDGTVGRPVREVRAKTVNRETGKDLPPGEPGMLYIAGPNVMKGYLGREDLTAEVIKDGWYVTGDIAVIDEDGFIRITGRESRFSKIGGEMVPHIQIEETLAQVVGLAEDGNPRVAVTAVPDAQRRTARGCPYQSGSHAGGTQPRPVDRRLAEPLHPFAGQLHADGATAHSGSGKLDLRAIRNLAMERFGP